MEPIKKCANCQCEIDWDEDVYFAFGMVLCYECAIDADPENPDYSE